ncbi:MAG: UvrB/UvrC motif-containing protein, partial [Pirellulales bacterium]|nr:UvrB/UvrC motif-containing protein [Pirellulales bacterium]
ATFHITELLEGKPVEYHLCEDCAKHYLTQTPTEETESPSLAGALAQQLAVGQTAEELARLDQKICPVCGISFYEFRNQGRLGCPHDYVCFRKELEPLLLNIHGDTVHAGKVPQSGVANSEQLTELIKLRRDMEEAVSGENYELASELRDRIQDIEQSSGKSTSD